jgi:3-oxoacyl-[acyl-carrier protein] reductase
VHVTSLTGQVAVVTGASRGIGRGIALHLARKGAAVAGIARPSDTLDDLRHAAGEDGGPLLTVPADVTSPEQVAAAFAEVGSQLGTPSLVVACAGSADVVGPLWSADPDEWWQAVSVDLRGTMLTAWSAIPSMLVARAGRFVTVYGNLGERQSGHVSAFAAAKAGIARLTESLAVELTGTGVLAFGMHPGFVRTPMTEQLAFGDSGRTWLPDFGASAERRWGDSRRAEQLVEAIARGDADQLAGRIIWVDDDLSELAESCHADPDLRRLRIKLT